MRLPDPSGQVAIHNEQPQELPETFNFERVYECGGYHHVANIAFYNVEKLAKQPEKSLYAKWEACRDQAVIRDINQSYAAEEIRNGLQIEGIRALEVQGTKIKPLYPQPEYRTMSDIDFIIDLDNLSKARAVLESLGYECKDSYGVEVDAFRPPNINIEMHTQYFPESVDYHSIMRPPFASVEETGEYDISEFYIYNMLHIAKHYFGGGCGIRRVLDVYYLNRNYGQTIDQKYVRSVLETAKVADLAAELAELANEWFGEGKQSTLRSDTASYIVGSGLHGTIPNALINHVKRTYNSNTRFAKLKYFLRRIIGTKEILYLTYPILEQHKILYPFCWLHRAFRALHPKTLKRLRREVTTVMNTKSQ